MHFFKLFFYFFILGISKVIQVNVTIFLEHLSGVGHWQVVGAAPSGKHSAVQWTLSNSLSTSKGENTEFDEQHGRGT